MVKFISDNIFISISDDRSIGIWDIENNVRTKTYNNHDSCINTIDISHDKKYIVYNTYNYVYVRNIITDEIIKIFEYDNDYPHEVSFFNNNILVNTFKKFYVYNNQFEIIHEIKL
jgi:WD40 repeat protein